MYCDQNSIPKLTAESEASQQCVAAPTIGFQTRQGPNIPVIVHLLSILELLLIIAYLVNDSLVFSLSCQSFLDKPDPDRYDRNLQYGLA